MEGSTIFGVRSWRSDGGEWMRDREMVLIGKCDLIDGV